MDVRQVVATFAFLLVPATFAEAQGPSRDPQRAATARPAPAADPGQRETALRAAIAAHPSDEKPYGELARLEESRGEYKEAEATLQSGKQALPRSKPMLQLMVAFYNRQRDFDRTIAALTDIVNLDPSDPQAHHTIATFYWEKAQKDAALSADEKRRYIADGIAAEDRALLLNPDFLEGLIYKNILLRLQAIGETDPAERSNLIAQADELRNRALQLQGVRGGVAGGDQEVRAMPVLPDDPPGSGPPLRAGSGISAPRKIKDVKPVYPPDLLGSGVEGIVIIEATIGTDGKVTDAKVLRSIRGLEAAAIEAVRQWEFTPTMLNGQPVPVIMTVTVNVTVK